MKKISGKIFKIIRESKNMSLKEVAANDISAAQLSRYERGISGITVDAFYRCLKNMAVSLDEFQCVYDNYAETADLAFSNKLLEAHREGNLVILQEMLNDCLILEMEHPNVKNVRLNTIMVKTFLSYSSEDFEVSKKDIDFLTDYLFSVEEWGRYELWLFTNSVDLMTLSTIETFASEMINRTQFYYHLPGNRKRIFKMLMSVVGFCIEADHLQVAMKFLNYLDHLKLSEDDLFEQMLIKYYKSLYAYVVGESSMIEDMKNCLSTLEYFGSYHIAQNLRKQLDMIQSR